VSSVFSGTAGAGLAWPGRPPPCVRNSGVKSSSVAKRKGHFTAHHWSFTDDRAIGAFSVIGSGA
jgi:hypothetical protein